MLGQRGIKALLGVMLLVVLSHGFATTISRFTPTGTQHLVDQAVAVFSNPVVRAGDGQQPDPFNISCEAPGSGRWLDSARWVYDFEQTVPAGTVCSFAVRPDFKPIEGGQIKGQTWFEFSTGGPSIRGIAPDHYDRVEEDQIFQVILTGKANAASITKNVWCEVSSVKERVPVRIIGGEERKKLLALLDNKDMNDRVVYLQCARKLPSGGEITLVWGKGVASANGKVLTETEKRTTFSVREPFTLSVECDRLKPGGACLPISPITINFSSPVSLDVAKRVLLKAPTSQKKPFLTSRNDPVDAIQFKGPFDENASMTLVLPESFKDSSGRKLRSDQKLPIQIKTAAIPPLVKFLGNFGILESKEGGVLPLTVRRIEPSLEKAGSASVSYLRLDGKTPVETVSKWFYQSQTFNDSYHDEGKPDPRSISVLADSKERVKLALPAPTDAKAAEVIGLPLGKPGFYVVEVESNKLGQALLDKDQPMYVRTTALVTNMAVHFKRSSLNGLVWVTALDSGKPLANVDVQVIRCDGKSVWTGKTDTLGLAAVSEPLPEVYECEQGNGYLVIARQGDDFSFVHSDWNDGIEPWRFNFYGGGRSDGPIIQSVLDRTLFKAGETVSMKLFARERVFHGGSTQLAFPKEKLSPEIRIEHTGSEDVYKITVEWTQAGTTTATFALPDNAKQGNYRILVDGKMVGSFYVSDFRLPILTGKATAAVDKAANGALPVSLQLNFLSGGPASGYPVQFSAMLENYYVYFDQLGAYSFNYDEESLKNRLPQDDEAQDANSRLIMDKEPVTLDDQGSGTVKITNIPNLTNPKSLITEMRFRDPNGETQSVHSRAVLWPADVVVGIQVADGWINPKRDFTINLVSVDPQGKFKPNMPVTVTAYKSEWFSHRRRVVGSFYAYESYYEVTKIGTVCTTKTDQYGRADCKANIAESGNIILVAAASDGRGKIAHASTSVWVNGEDSWFSPESQDRIDVLPEKKQYMPGETARFQVRMPFRQATALIAVEREGIMETFVKELSASDPSFELPILNNYGPNVYVSVLAVRGRVEEITLGSFLDWGWKTPIDWFKAWWNQPDKMVTTTVDLAKPAYKFGITEIEVGQKDNQLNVQIKTDKPVYQTRDIAQATVTVTLPDGKPAPKGTEVILVGVDQALLELKENDSWDLLAAMYPRHGYEVVTATAQMQVIGKRHFGRKATAPGGGGGMMAALNGEIRQEFNPLLVWLPKVTLNDQGKATVDVPLNDSLTTFTLVAISAVGADRFGTGKAEIKATRNLQLFSEISPIVRGGDKIDAAVTAHNSTQKPMTVSIRAEAIVDGKTQSFDARQVTIEAGKSQEVSWRLSVPKLSQHIQWRVFAKDAQSKNEDSLAIAQDVLPVTQVTVRQAMFTQLDEAKAWQMVNPAGALEGQSKIEVGLSASIGGNREGLRRFFEQYPFNCLEQQIAKAVGLEDKDLLEKINKRLPDFLDKNGLLRYYPSDYTEGSVALTAHVLALADVAQWQLPDRAQTEMQKALLDFVEGRLKPSTRLVYANEMVELKLMALNSLSRMKLVRPKMLESIPVDLSDWPTSSLIDWMEILRRTPMVADRDAKMQAVEKAIRSRINEQGTKTSFSTASTDDRWTMMANSDTNAIRLVMAIDGLPQWQSDYVYLLRGALDRQVRGRWSTTTANVWGSLLLGQLEKKEKQKPTGVTRTTLGTQTGSFDWASKERGLIALPWGSIKPGEGEKLTLSHQGQGKPWVLIQSLAAVPLKKPVFSGFSIQREIIPVEQKVKGQWSRGDRVRIRLTINAKASSGWVVVSDPIIAGARILGASLGRDSAVEKNESAARGNWPSFEERRNDRYTAYFDYIRAGQFSIEYVVQFNSAGQFNLPETRVESLYAPEVFGEIPNASMTVRP